jgi:putative copper export protein
MLLQDPTPLLDAATGARWLGYVSLFPVVGAAVFRVLVRRTGSGWPDMVPRLERRAAAVGLVAAIALLVELLLKLYLQARAFSDPTLPLSMDDVHTVLQHTRWGNGWHLQFMAAVLALAGYALARRWPSGWLVVFAAVLFCLIATPLTGHATEHPWGPQVGQLLHSLHVGAASAWLGTLAALVASVYPATLDDPRREQILARLVHAFSPLALASAGTAVALGVVLGLTYNGGIGAIFTTVYGRTMLVKVALLGGVLVMGWYNWKRVRPALGAEPGMERLARSAVGELVLGTLLLAVTAVLVALPAAGLGE